MPRRTTTRKKYTPKKRTTKRIRPMRKPRKFQGPFRAISGFDPFPLKYTAKMRYCQTYQYVTGTAGVFGGGNTYRLNSLYDPDLTGAGHQPYGYDQISALYRRYLVRGVKITVIFNNPSVDGIVCGAMIQGSGGVGTLAGQTADIIKEQPYSVTRVLNSTGKQFVTISQYIDLAKLEGLNRVQWIANQDQYGALVSANPALCPTLQVAIASDAAEAGASCTIRILFTYYSQFYDRILQAYS